nr:PREDICTED: carcinoembryonic antigen-related cell adhesion molecule 1-like [Anolis carolinensis]|eukprot:XP_016854473.1 PREDICTED: carcinoembryonic antigen-related cell adhesion molecule 1-like [Anolis carolinensis]
MLSPLPSVEILSKPTIPRPPVPFPIENLDSLHLTCNTSSILADVAWLLNRRPLGNSSRIQLSDNNRTLDISPVLRSDAGDYQCRVFNPAFSETSDAFYIPVICEYPAAVRSVRSVCPAWTLCSPVSFCPVRTASRCLGFFLGYIPHPDLCPVLWPSLSVPTLGVWD